MQAVRVAAAAAVAAALLCQAVAMPEEVGAEEVGLESDFVDVAPVAAKSVGTGDFPSGFTLRGEKRMDLT